MFRTLIIATSMALAGCSIVNSGDLATQALGNLEHCKRTYQATVGAFGIPGGSLFIECPAKPHSPP